MKLTIVFDRTIRDEERSSIKNPVAELGGRIFRIAGDDVIVAEGSYSDMMDIVAITSYLKHKKLNLSK